jgi:phosphoribosylformylglycinamidine cyclo-ligase
LDYIAAGKIESERMAELVEGVAEGCRQAGCALIGGEMAEHPGVMGADEFDMSGFCVGVVDRPHMIDGSGIAAGDVILGLPSSGLHSNGFSLVRRVVADLSLDETYPELEGQTLGEALLTPTRIYARVVQSLLKAGLPIKGMAHITGGGITENLDRVLSAGLDALVNIESWEVPPVIRFISEQANLSQEEALKTFNCGIGLALLVAAEDAETIKDTLLVRGEPVYEIGKVIEGTGTVRYE